MNNHFLLDLDTTAPDVEIYAPYFTTPNATAYIFVEADEPLDNWQEIYTIDSAGTRRDHIFHFDGNNQFMGEISMIDYPEGNVTICARVRDTVHNTSHLAEKTMLVSMSEKIDITIRDFLVGAINSREMADWVTARERVQAIDVTVEGVGV